MSTGIRATDKDTISDFDDVIGIEAGSVGRLTKAAMTSALAVSLVAAGTFAEARPVAMSSGSTAFDYHTNTSGYLFTDSEGAKFTLLTTGVVYASDVCTLGTGITKAAATKNSETLQRVINWLAYNGGGTIIFDAPRVELYGMLYANDRVTIWAYGCRIVQTYAISSGDTPSGGTGYLSDAVINCGTFASQDVNAFTWHELNAVTKGAETVTLTDSGDRTSYAAGDVVLMLEAYSTMGDGSTIHPINFEWNRLIEDPSTGALKLEFPTKIAIASAGAGSWGTNPTGAWIANYAFRTSNGRSTLGDAGTPRYCVDRFRLLGAELEIANPTTGYDFVHFTGRGAAFECLFRDVTIVGQSIYGIYGNAFPRSRFENVGGSYLIRAIEIKAGSHDVEVIAPNFHKRSDGLAAFTSRDPIIAFAERNRDIIVRRPVIDTGNSHGSGQNMISMDNCYDCVIEDMVQRGTATFASVIAYGTGAERCKLLGGSAEANASRSCRNLGTDCEVRGVTFLTAPSVDAYNHDPEARGGRIEGNSWPTDCTVSDSSVTGSGDKALTVRDNRNITMAFDSGRPVLAAGNISEGWLEVRAAASVDDVDGDSTSSTSEVLLGDAITIPAGKMGVGMQFKWVIEGECTGGNGTRTVSFRASVDTDDDGATIDGDDDTNVADSIALPATCFNWRVTATTTVILSNRLVTKFEAVDLDNGTIYGDVIRHTGADFATYDAILQFTGLVANASDLLIVRSIDRSATYEGYL